MDDQTDLQLLRAYSETRSDEAFATLVRRHIDLVHSAAMRMVCDSHLAQDVTQNTFVALAKNAPDLMMRPVISGWLHRTAQNIAAQIIRTDVRRRNREQEATAMNTLLSEAPDASWQEIAPHLDAALGQLDDVDRDAVLLRYFEKKSAREMATQLGISDDAAQKRVSRAVVRLREFFAKRGITVGTSGLVVVISANAVQAAPVGLAVTISTAAALTGTTLATTTTATAIKTIAMTTLQKTVITATLAIVAGVGIYEARQNIQLREQNQMIQQERAPLAEQMRNLQKSYDDATNQLAALRDDNERLNRNTGELLKLRGDVSRLRTTAGELARASVGSDIKTNEGFGGTADAWAKRANSFKQWFEQNPDKSIPELQLLTEADWLFEASMNLKEITNRLEGNDIHMIADSLRQKAKHRFANSLGHALGNYITSNDGSLPNDLSQLLQYFSPPGDVSMFARSIDPSILQRYDLLHTGMIRDVPEGAAIIREKSPVDDVIDGLLSVAVGSYAMQSTGEITDGMRQGQSHPWSDEDAKKKIEAFLK